MKQNNFLLATQLQACVRAKGSLRRSRKKAPQRLLDGGCFGDLFQTEFQTLPQKKFQRSPKQHPVMAANWTRCVKFNFAKERQMKWRQWHCHERTPTHCPEQGQ
jgi:hypothetical protein